MPAAICRRPLALHGCHACSPDFDPTITRFVHCERGEYRSRAKTRIPRARQEPPEQKPGEADKAAGENGEGAWPNWRPESFPPRPPRSPQSAMASIPSTLQHGPPEHADPLRTPALESVDPGGILGPARPCLHRAPPRAFPVKSGTAFHKGLATPCGQRRERGRIRIVTPDPGRGMYPLQTKENRPRRSKARLGRPGSKRRRKPRPKRA